MTETVNGVENEALLWTVIIMQAETIVVEEIVIQVENIAIAEDAIINEIDRNYTSPLAWSLFIYNSLLNEAGMHMRRSTHCLCYQWKWQ